MTVKVGYLLPTRESVMEGRPEAEPLMNLAERAESLGYDSVWVGDSLLARPRHEPSSQRKLKPRATPCERARSVSQPRGLPVAGSAGSMARYSFSVETQWGGYLKRATSSTSTRSRSRW